MTQLKYPGLLAGMFTLGSLVPESTQMQHNDDNGEEMPVINGKERARRFKARKVDALKQWNLSPIDMASVDHWDDYTEAKEAMFFYTDNADSPWTIVESDDKKRARLNCMRHFLSTLPYPGKNRQVVRDPDRLIIGSSIHVVHASEHILGKSMHPEARRNNHSYGDQGTAEDREV